VSLCDDLIKEYEERFMPGGILQARSEIKQLVEEVGERKFKVMAEIGTSCGGTLWLYANLFAEKDGCFIINDMEIPPVLKRVMSALEERIGLKFKVFECKSYLFSLKEPVEFLHIDGDHSYEAVRHDYYSNFSRVTPGGIIVLHDTMLMPGVMKFREELEKSGVETKTFIGYDTLCDCFGKGKINLFHQAFGTTVVYKNKENKQ